MSTVITVKLDDEIIEKQKKFRRHRVRVIVGSWVVWLSYMGVFSFVIPSPPAIFFGVMFVFIPVLLSVDYRRYPWEMFNVLRNAIGTVDPEMAERYRSGREDMESVADQIFRGGLYDWAVADSYRSDRNDTNITSIAFDEATYVITMRVKNAPKKAAGAIKKKEILSTAVTHKRKPSQYEKSLRQRSEKLTEKLTILSEQNLTTEQQHAAKRIHSDLLEGWELYNGYFKLGLHTESAAAESRMNSILSNLEKEVERILAQAQQNTLDKLEVHDLYVGSANKSTNLLDDNEEKSSKKR